MQDSKLHISDELIPPMMALVEAQAVGANEETGVPHAGESGMSQAGSGGTGEAEPTVAGEGEWSEFKCFQDNVRGLKFGVADPCPYLAMGDAIARHEGQRHVSQLPVRGEPGHSGCPTDEGNDGDEEGSPPAPPSDPAGSRGAPPELEKPPPSVKNGDAAGSHGDEIHGGGSATPAANGSGEGEKDDSESSEGSFMHYMPYVIDSDGETVDDDARGYWESKGWKFHSRESSWRRAREDSDDGSYKQAVSDEPPQSAGEPGGDVEGARGSGALPPPDAGGEGDPDDGYSTAACRHTPVKKGYVGAKPPPGLQLKVSPQELAACPMPEPEESGESPRTRVTPVAHSKMGRGTIQDLGPVMPTETARTGKDLGLQAHLASLFSPFASGSSPRYLRSVFFKGGEEKKEDEEGGGARGPSPLRVDGFFADKGNGGPLVLFACGQSADEASEAESISAKRRKAL